MFYDNQARKYVDVSDTNPFPVTLVDGGLADTEDDTVTVTVHRNARGDTTQVIEHSALTGKSTTTNFTYVEEA